MAESGELISIFYDYLNWENKGVATSDMGLIANAPQEAIDAYEKYKKDEIQDLENGKDWE